MPIGSLQDRNKRTCGRRVAQSRRHRSLLEQQPTSPHLGARARNAAEDESSDCPTHTPRSGRKDLNVHHHVRLSPNAMSPVADHAHEQATGKKKGSTEMDDRSSNRADPFRRPPPYDLEAEKKKRVPPPTERRIDTELSPAIPTALTFRKKPMRANAFSLQRGVAGVVHKPSCA